MSKSLCVGIAGGSGSGKTTLARRLAACLEEKAVLVALDWYYKDLAHLELESRRRENFDHPGALEWERLVADVETLAKGGTAEVPVYDFAEHCRKLETLRLESKPVVLIEGIHALHDPRLRALLDLGVFVDADADVRLARRLRRDVAERGRSEERVLRRYEGQVRPMHAAFVEPAKGFADLVISGVEIGEEAARVLAAIRGLAR